MDSVAGTKGDYAAITREEPATNLLPSAKFKRHIVAALNSDDLYFRTPRLNADSFSGTTRETSYLSRGDSISLGAIHFVKNGRFKCYTDLRIGVAIVKPQVLFAYKEDGRSDPMQHDLKKTGQIEHQVRLLDSSDVHVVKHREMTSRYCSHYLEWTSGHLLSNGHYSPRTFKEGLGYYQSKPAHNETLLEKYTQDQLAGIAGFNLRVLSQHHIINSWTEMLKMHQLFMSQLPDQPELPLIFGQESPARILSVVSLKEHEVKAEELLEKLAYLRDFCLSHGVDPDSLGVVLSRLPADIVLQRVMRLDCPKAPPAQSEALKLAVRSGQNNYWENENTCLPGLDEIQTLINDGADFNRTLQLADIEPPIPLVMITLFSGSRNDVGLPLTNPDARKKLSAEQIILKKKESEELVSELVKHDFIIPDKITLSRFNLDDNPYAFTQLLRQGARLDKDVLGRLLPSLYQDLKFLPKDDFSALYKEAFDLSVQEFGWQKINEHVKRDLFGSFGYLNLNAKMLAYCLGIEWFINDIRCALTSIECGALCEIESSETTVLQEMYELAPEQFVSAYGFNASDLIAHLEQCNQKNSPQSSWQERTAEISTPPAGCEVDSLISLFQPDKPRLQQAESLEERIQLILDNYYSAPGPSKARALMLSKSDNIRDRLRSLHDCDHAVRTALFTQAFAQLLKAQDATSKAYFEKNTELEELLVLAEAYHDVVAEDEPKDQEEIHAAFYLLRDLKGLYPDELLVEVAVALANKNVSHSSGDLEQSRKRILDKVPGFLLDQVDPELREALKARFFVPDSSSSSDFQKWLRMVIRFGDTVDIARCFGEQGFKWELLPLPDGWSSNADAMKQVRQLVSSCWNLAALTGGAPRDNAYAEANGLRNPQNNYGKPLEHNELVRRDISARENVWTAIRQELDRMAKRTLATKAGIHTATSEDAPLSTSSTYFRIFDERDLDQIELPEGLTELDTLQISSGDLEQLNPGLQKQLKDSINKLRLSGIRHPLGTVSQETLGSKDAVTELSKRGFRVWNDERVFDGVPVTVKRLSKDSAADAIQSE